MDIKETTPFHTNEWIKQYRRNASDVHSFYAYSPLTEDVFVQRAQEIDSQTRVHASREKLAQVISSFHESMQPHSKIKRNITRFRDGNSLVVIGGHQACLLTGPLYTIYKAITVIQLARREEKRLGRPVIPVFWIAGEDHDWDEVNHVWIQGVAQKPSKLRFPSTCTRKQISEVICNPQEMHSWLDDLIRLLPDSIYKKEWVTILKEFTSTSITWTCFFAKVMMHLFGKYGLLLVDAADPNIRKLEEPFWRVLLTQNEEIQSLIREKSSQMIELGYPAPIPDKEHFAHLFLCNKGNRYPLYFDGVKWTASGIDGAWHTSDMLSLINTYPERLSNNVMTRPLMQEFLFPTLAFVGGPAEVQYWGILKDIFTVCGLLEMPILYPRLQMTLLSPCIQKRMHGLGVTLTDVTTRFDEVKGEWLQKQHNTNVESLFLEAKKEIESTHQRLLQQIDKELEINLLASGQLNKNKLIEHLVYLQKHIEHKIESKYQVGIRQWDEVLQTIYPDNKPQERIYNIINYWNLYGLEWLDELVNTPLLTENSTAYSISI